MTFFHAEYTSRNFYFDAFGATKALAIEALRGGLSDHGRQYRLEADWYHVDDIAVREVEMGEAYRDCQKIKRSK
jgi:hypothetical protein